MQDIFQDYVGLLQYMTIPLVSGLVGWWTNVMAVKMTFYPIEFVGIRPYLGWQGIIPSKAKKMGGKAVDLLSQKLLSMEVEFERIDPIRVSEEMKPALEDMSKKIIDEVMVAQIPDLWEKAPQGMRDAIYETVAKEMPHLIQQIMDDMKNNIDQLIDLKTLTVNTLSKDKELVNQIFFECGRKEFRFIEKSGFYFGALFGLVQMIVFYFYSPWWMLPLFGVLVGYATNWLALKLIFEPTQPRKFGPVVVQGLFLKRQQEVAGEYANIIATKLLTSEAIFEYMVRGPGSKNLAELVKNHVDHVVDKIAGNARNLIDLVSGPEKMEVIKSIVFFRFRQELPISIRSIFKYAEDALNIRAVLSERMIALSPEEFESFLRPAFQEDELTLILVGALLGCLAGFAQYFIFFS
ncbi:hypothetical protein R9C00_15765 [Flammeovirgaceae bacterium SG7u.111]|nr:hypothetical protein [Flammeovirgaceae bacterium SG7u.132]WPO33159.1 hypothetical protein R9C00_15765 [Flammeovirgaceae bacterium SG7u.111]